jgi:hypothetical protein
MVSVSAIEDLRALVVGVVALVCGNRLASRAVPSLGPPREILIPAPFAAERLPAVVDRVPAAQDAQLRLAHQHILINLL